jgi:actinorhodin biosynthesis protein ActVIA
MSPNTEMRACPSAELYVEVQTYYARQMRLIDNLDIEKFAETFTEDGVVEHQHRGERTQGRSAMIAGMQAALHRYSGVVTRHWFDKVLVAEQDDGSISVSYYALVTHTESDGRVTFEPTFTVEDVLVRLNGELFTRSRRLARDAPVRLPTPASAYCSPGRAGWQGPNPSPLR